MDVELQYLVDYAGKRWEDAYAMHGIMNYEQYVGAIPIQVWGTLPWSRNWATGWRDAVGARMTEAQTMRDQFGSTSGRLLQVAADYGNADAESAADIELSNKFTRPFLDQLLKDGAHTGRAHPGGQPPMPTYPPPQRIPDLSGNGRLNGLADDGTQLPHFKDELHADMDGHGRGSRTAVGVTNDQLDQFVAKYWGYFPDIDYACKQAGQPQPWAEYIEPAWKSVPAVISDRADLFFEVSNSIDEIYLKMAKHDTPGLREKWNSPGAAAAFFRHAEAMHGYLQTMKTETDWLAKEGKKAADLLLGLRNRYAEIGYQHMTNLAKKVQEYQALATSTISRITSCSSPSGALSAIAEAAAGYATALGNEQQRRLGEAQALLTGEELVRKEKPDFATSEHATKPFPAESIDAGAWYNGKAWKPLTSAPQR